MSFERLLDELAEVDNKRRLAKAQDPNLDVYYYEEMPPMLAQFHEAPLLSFEQLGRKIESLKKSFSTPSATAGLRTEETRRQELRKSLPGVFERFSVNLKQSLISGAVSPEQASLLEWHRNRLAQQFADRGLL